MSSLMHLMIKITVRLMYRFTVDGSDNVRAPGPMLLAVNSVSFIDTLLVLAALKRPAMFIVDARDLDQTRLRPLLLLCGAVPADAGNEAAKWSAYEKASAVLSRGGIVGVFPEGKMSRSGFLGGFDNRAAEIAAQSECPVVPVYIDSMRGSRRRQSRADSVLPGQRWRRPVTIVFGKPRDHRAAPAALRSAVEELSSRAYELRKKQRRSLGYMLVRSARSHWRKTCMSDTTGKKFTCGTMLVASLIIKNVLDRKLAPEQAIGVLLPASCGGALVNVGVLLAGKTPVNLNFTTSSENIAFAVRACSITTVITSKLFMKRMGHLTIPGTVLYLEDLVGAISPVDRIIALVNALFVPAALLAGERGIHPDDTATIVFSSGSTSNPKGVMLTHHTIISNIEQMHTVFDFTTKDCMVAALPFFHSFGFTVTLWLPLLAGFRAAYHPNPLEAGTMVSLIAKEKATILPCTPTFLQTYMRKAEPDGFSTMRLIISGAEKLRPSLAKAFEEKFKVAPLEGYGATEMSPVGALNVPDSTLWETTETGTRLGTVGRLVPGMCARIVDPDSGTPLEPGAAGLLLLKGPNIMKGYLGNPSKTAEAIVDGWYNTGDIASIAPDGFVTLSDRLSRFSKIGGEMVPHGAIEEALMRSLETDEQVVAVTAVPDNVKGERLAVLYTAAAGIPETLRAALDNAKVPNLWKPPKDAWVKVDAIPVLGTGKTDLKKVRELALSHCRTADE
jgi:acyl-[acyl-carrier-protein]-phospholipid O-acyltransferase/long-chain-fatty-acid--[acyl-carrier-protein] ligase